MKNTAWVNTDDIVRSFGNWTNISDVTKAGKIAIQRIREYFEKGVSFSQETTLCGRSILRNIGRARELGYFIEIHYVGVESVQVAKERVAYRVAHGGHGIPDEDIERRYSESFERLKQVLPLCDMAVLYDNTTIFQRFAIFQNGKLIKINNYNIPEWYSKLFDCKE